MYHCRPWRKSWYACRSCVGSLTHALPLVAATAPPAARRRCAARRRSGSRRCRSSSRSKRLGPEVRSVSASTSCATMRTRSPARRTLPSSTVVAPSVAPISRKLCSRFLNRMTEVREITLSARIFESCAMTSSVIPSAKYSFSGSALRLRKGARRRTSPAGRDGAGAVSASANSPAVANRSAGTLASARRSPASTGAGTVSRSRRTAGTGSRQPLGDDRLGVGPRERRLAGEHLVQHAAEAVHVAAAVDARVASACSGLMYSRRADDEARLGDARRPRGARRRARCRSRRPSPRPRGAGCSPA